MDFIQENTVANFKGSLKASSILFSAACASQKVLLIILFGFVAPAELKVTSDEPDSKSKYSVRGTPEKDLHRQHLRYNKKKNTNKQNQKQKQQTSNRAGSKTL